MIFRLHSFTVQFYIVLLTLVLVNIAQSTAQSTAQRRPPQSTGKTRLALDTTNSYVVPGAASTQYRLTIHNSMYGRYTITMVAINEPVSGWLSWSVQRSWSWSVPADGIYYCVQGGSTIEFDEFPSGAVVDITAEVKETDCVDGYIGFNGLTSTTTPSWGGTGAIYWSSDRYYLKASKFEIQVNTEPAPWTMSDATEVAVGGDPGSANYFTIEIEWRDAGIERRLNIYFDGKNDGTWQASEARIYNPAGTSWVEPFFGKSAMESLSWVKGKPFKKKSLTISNGAGTELRFTDLTIHAYELAGRCEGWCKKKKNSNWKSKCSWTSCRACLQCKSAATPPPTTKALPVCPKCGSNKAGKRSCCVRRGAWFGNCGNPGDSKFDHTWTEGMEACKTASTKSTAPPSMVAPLTPGCPMCGTLKQSGKQSCCARGGAWFGNCGNPDDGGVDHTWSEGIQACTSSSFSGEAQSQVMLQENATIDQQVHANNQSTVESGGGVHGVIATNSKGYDGLTNIVTAFTSLLLISFNM